MKLLRMFSYFFMVGLFSCTYQKFVKNDNINLNLTLKGKVAYVGTLLVDPAASWNDGNYKYTVPYSNPFIPTIVMFKSLTPENRKKIFVNSYDTNEVKVFKEKMKKAGIESYAHMPGFIPVFDSSDSKRKVQYEKMTNFVYMIDEDCMNFLNSKIDADYYMVFIGRIVSFKIPYFLRLSGSFELEPEWRILIFDKEGKKVFSKPYKWQYVSYEQNAHMRVMNYYVAMEQNIIANKDTINEDLANLLTEVQNVSYDVSVDSLLELIIKIEEERNKFFLFK
ncbi:MAG: hypothetical protein ACP5Q5_08350 [Brevinematia bacterium]